MLLQASDGREQQWVANSLILDNVSKAKKASASSLRKEKKTRPLCVCHVVQSFESHSSSLQGRLSHTKVEKAAEEQHSVVSSGASSDYSLNINKINGIQIWVRARRLSRVLTNIFSHAELSTASPHFPLQWLTMCTNVYIFNKICLSV